MPAADQANASQADPPGLTVSVSVSALQHLIIEVLRRPVEFTLRPGITVMYEAGEGVAPAGVDRRPNASSTKSVRMEADTRQPTMRRANTLMTNAT